ncbi:hypothetical protein TYRP_023052 [Tyrophagus putrescentiae]|nr:hypothetical protein TYRP_023052 [Tyrophagus putrescentiae]
MFALPIERQKDQKKQPTAFVAEVAFLSGRGGQTLTVAKNFSINIDSIISIISNINSINNINNNLSSSSKTKMVVMVVVVVVATTPNSSSSTIKSPHHRR